MLARQRRFLSTPEQDPYGDIRAAYPDALIYDFAGVEKKTGGKPYFLKDRKRGLHPRELGGWSYTKSGILTFVDPSLAVQQRGANDDTVLPTDGGLPVHQAATNICNAANWNPTATTNLTAYGSTLTVVQVADLPANVRTALLRRYPRATSVYKCVCPGVAVFEGVGISGQLAANTPGSLQVSGFVESGAVPRFGLRGSTNLTGGSQALGVDFEIMSVENIQSTAARAMGIHTQSSGDPQATTFYFHMFQLETGTFCTSCIPSSTTGGASRGGVDAGFTFDVTAGADVLLSGVTALSNISGVTQTILNISDGTSANQIIVERQSTNLIAARVLVASVNSQIATVSKAGARTLGWAVRRVGDLWSLYADGVLIGSLTIVGLPTISTGKLGATRLAGAQVNGAIMRQTAQLGGSAALAQQLSQAA